MKTRFILLVLAVTLSCLNSRTTAAQPADIVSVSTGLGATAAGLSLLPSFSGDGRYLLFLSQANNLVTNDDRAPHLDLFRWDLTNGADTLVSVNQTGQGGGEADSNFGQISSNGQRIVFASAAGNLVASDGNQASDVFLRDLIAGTTQFVSQTPSGLGGNAASTASVMSTDGRWVAFESSASDLAQLPDTNDVSDIYVRDLGSNITALVSVDSGGASSGSGASDSPAISADGRFVAFVSTASNLVATPPESSRAVYVRDLQQNLTVCASAGVSPFFEGTYQVPSQQPALSADGRYIVFTVENRLFRFDRLLNSTVEVGVGPQFPSDFRATLSTDGRFIAYQDGTNVWRWDGVLQTNILVNLTSDGVAPTNGYSFNPVLSSDGQQVLFYSSASGLVTNEGNQFYQLYLRDLTSGLTRLLSLNQREGAGDRDSFPGTAVFNPDGTVVAFDSLADDLVADDLNQASDVFLHRLDASLVELVSGRSSLRPPGTSVAHCRVYGNGVSTNGQVILINSYDNQFIPGDTNGLADAFVADVTAGTVKPVLLTRAEERILGQPALSGNGRYVAVARPTNAYWAIDYVRYDLVTETHVVVTNGYLDFELTNHVILDADGRRMAYVLVPNYEYQQLRIHDFHAGTDVVVTNGYSSSLSFTPLSFSADGRCLAFRADWQGSWVDGVIVIDGQMRRLARLAPSGVLAIVFSGDSRYAVFQESYSIFRHDLAANFSGAVCIDCYAPSVSGDGRLVAYLGTNYSTAFRWQVIVQDIQANTAQLISINRCGTAAGNGQMDSPSISSDGRHVVFASGAGDLVENDTNKVFDIFLRDRLLGTTTCLSVNQQGVPASGSSGNPVLSGDGRTVVFQSTANDLVFADYNDKRDVFAMHIGHDDTDGDGLDDDWEMAFFENLAHDGSVDSDSDGLSDRAEFLAGTDPTNTGSVLRATALVPLGGGNTAILWQAVPGRTYQVQFKNSLGDANWSVLPGTVTATTTTGVMTDATASGTPQRFYRVIIVP